MSIFKYTFAKTNLALVLALAVNLVSATPVHPQNSEVPTALEVKGRILIKNKDIKGSYKVEVMHFNSITETFTVKGGEAINLHLKTNSAYTLKISKKGFTPRYISLNTHQMKERKESYAFHVETDFIEVSDAMRMNSESLEMPAAIISFNSSTGNLTSNSDYAYFVNQRIAGELDDQKD